MPSITTARAPAGKWVTAGTVIRHATMMAYNDVFWVMGVLFVLSLPFLFLLGSHTKRSTPVASTPAPTPPAPSASPPS